MARHLSDAAQTARQAEHHDRQRLARDGDRGDSSPAAGGRADVPVSYSVQGEKTSPHFARAFAQGCDGRAVPHDGGLQPGPIAAFGTPPTWPLFAQAQAEGREWYYGDHGHFRRFQYYRVTKDQYQHDGRGVASPDRFMALHVDRAPEWKTDGHTVVVCPQSPIYMAHHFGIGLPAADGFVTWITAQLRAYTDRPIIVRWKSQATERPLRVDLQDAWIVVTWSSASAVEALAAGVPVCTLAPWASTARMGVQDLATIESPIYPDMGARDQFLFNLADQQWTMEEIERGAAWRALHAT